ncbi:MAG TPA: endonuclease domain-containing protein [Cyclobacteriaceae bacterium]|nr:endonuclease domain-containing protein [Cyclobacteriaceae bacterium]
MTQQSMFYGASPEIFRKAVMLRSNETEAEKKLWSLLRNNQLDGFRFRRQHPISTFVADFYCHKLRLVVEVDEKYHLGDQQQEKDIYRNDYMLQLGITVIRFSDAEVLTNIDSVINVIKDYIQQKSK